MRCDFETLCLYLNNDLDAGRRFEVLAHLDQCEICMEAFTQMSAEQDERYLKLASHRRWKGQKRPSARQLEASS